MIGHHAQLGIEYLMKIGYKEDEILTSGIPENCGYDRNCRPDIITKTDCKGWEVKFLIGKKILITENQFLYMEPYVNILIFGKDGFMDIIKMEELLNIENQKYDIRIVFRTNLRTGYEIRNEILKEHNDINKDFRIKHKTYRKYGDECISCRRTFNTNEVEFVGRNVNDEYLYMCGNCFDFNDRFPFAII